MVNNEKPKSFKDLYEVIYYILLESQTVLRLYQTKLKRIWFII